MTPSDCIVLGGVPNAPQTMIHVQVITHSDTERVIIGYMPEYCLVLVEVPDPTQTMTMSKLACMTMCTQHARGSSMKGFSGLRWQCDYDLEATLSSCLPMLITIAKFSAIFSAFLIVF